MAVNLPTVTNFVSLLDVLIDSFSSVWLALQIEIEKNNRSTVGDCRPLLYYLPLLLIFEFTQSAEDRFEASCVRQ